jgi:hypothetical protein
MQFKAEMKDTVDRPMQRLAMRVKATTVRWHTAG